MSRNGSAEQAHFLSSLPAERKDRLGALALLILSVLIFAALAPFARQPLPPVPAFIPIYESALAINDLITAAILFGQFNILRSRALLVLAAGYLFTALIVVPHALTFPGLFSPTGLLGAGPQSTVWLYLFWHAGFPVAVIAYALLKDQDTATDPSSSVRLPLLVAVGLVVAVVTALALLATAGHAALPQIMRGNNTTSGLVVVVSIIWALCVVALFLIWRRRPHSVLDLWLMVVMCAWIFDMALSAALNAARFDLGFYSGRIYGLLASMIVLLVLLFETGALYAQLATLFAVEQQERRREAEERRRIFETSLDLILVVDRQGTFIRVSPSSMAILGYEPTEMVNRNAMDFLYPDDLKVIRAEMRRARHGHLIRDFATRYFHKDGRIVMLSWSGVWSEPEQRHFFIGRDVTEQKRIERMKDEFVATVSHELRTPITTIAGPLALLVGGAGGELPEPAKRLVSMAQTNSKRLAALVNDILDFENIRTGRITFNFRRVELKVLLEQVIEANRPLAEKSDVRLRLDMNASDAVARTDADRLAQAITNLLSNAIKFSPPGEEVMVLIETRDDVCRIAVRDRGRGIPDEVKAQLFEKFVRGDAIDARQKGGNGLGLSIVKETMIRLHGDVGCTAAPSGGTIFHLEVPRWNESMTQPPPAIAAA